MPTTQLSHIYEGKFRDKNENLSSAGILTYVPGENMDNIMRVAPGSAPSELPSNIAKYTVYRAPELAEKTVHYGRYNDPKEYLGITHGLATDKHSLRVKDSVNPKVLSSFQHLKNDMVEKVYKSRRSAPLGHVPVGVVPLPASVNRYESLFGRASNRCETVKECVSPAKSRDQVELEASDKHNMYVFSHGSFEPGERRDRLFVKPFDEMQIYGKRTQAHYDGRNAREAMNWLPLKLLGKRTQVDTCLLDDFREKHTNQLGQVLDPNKETRFVGPDHVFGLNNNNETFGAGDIVHGRAEDKVLRGKDRERAFVATARTCLARMNLVHHKTLYDAFVAYDKDKDGLVSKEELKNGSHQVGFPIANDLLDALFAYCNQSSSSSGVDVKLNFVTFANFLCYKDSMKLGVDIGTVPENQVFTDKEGRALFNANDLVHKNNIDANELVLKTIETQLDAKVGNWKTTADLINDAPYRKEPTIKRVYGIPSIRSDITAPDCKKIQDRTNYGNDGNVWSMLTPSIYTQHGVYAEDFLKPRARQEIEAIFRSIGFELTPDLFDKTWSAASAANGGANEASVEAFRSALNHIDFKPLGSSAK